MICARHLLVIPINTPVNKKSVFLRHPVFSFLNALVSVTFF